MRAWKILSPNKKSFVLEDLQYSTKKSTKPRRGWGPLCCFKTRKEAQDFVYSNFGCTPYILWRVEIVKSRKMRAWNPYHRQVLRKDLPDGTILADEVRFVREIVL